MASTSSISSSSPTEPYYYNIYQFVKKLSQIYPAASSLVNTIQDHQQDTQKLNSLIKTWFDQNRQELSQMTSLNLESCRLTRVPDEINYFTYLSNLNLGRNPNVNFSAIESLTHLKNLYLNDNQLRQLPSFLENRQYRVIDLSDNDLPEIPTFVEHLQSVGLKGNRFGLEKKSGKKWDGSSAGVKDECLRYCLFTPLVHSAGLVINIVFKIVKIVSFSHFWLNLDSQKPYSFFARAEESLSDGMKAASSPLLFIWLEAVAIYGYLVNPYKGVILYGKSEKFIYGCEVMGNQLVDNLALASFFVAHRALILYCCLKIDKYI